MRPRWIFLLLFLLLIPMPEYTAEQYIDDVVSGRQVVCKWTRLAVERHLRDLDRIGNPDFPYYFDEVQAKRVINFKQELRHTKGEWANPRKHDTRIRLEPWQQFKDWVLFGWRREGGYRRFTKAYITVGRKNGKTVDAAAHGSLSLMSQAASLLRGLLLPAGKRAFTFAGQPAILTYSGELQQREILSWVAESTRVLLFEAISTKIMSERAYSTKVIEFDAE